MKRPDYRLEQSGAVLKHFPLQVLHENVRLQTGAVLKHFPLQIFYEKDRLQATLQTGAVWSCSVPFSYTNPLRKGFITDWSWSEAFSFTHH